MIIVVPAWYLAGILTFIAAASVVVAVRVVIDGHRRRRTARQQASQPARQPRYDLSVWERRPPDAAPTPDPKP